MEHVILRCPDRISRRTGMIAEARTHGIYEILTRKRGIQAAAKWIFREGILSQFQYARKLATETDQPHAWNPFPFLEDDREEGVEERA